MLLNRNMFRLCCQRSKQWSKMCLQQSNHCKRVISTSPCHNRITSKWLMPYAMEMKKRQVAMDIKGLIPIDRRCQFLEWNLDSELYAFGKRIREVIDKSLLMTAITDASHIKHVREQQEVHGLIVPGSSGVPQQQYDLNPTAPEEECNAALAARGREIVRTECKRFIQVAYPNLPLEGVSALVSHLSSDDVLGKVGLSIGLKDIVFAEPYPPSPAIMARTAAAIIAAVERSAGASRADAFVVDFVAVHLSGRNMWDLWQVKDPLEMLNAILQRSGKGDVEARMVHQTGMNTLEASYQVALYMQDKSFFSTGYGESIDVAVAEAALDGLSRLFGSTQSQQCLPFTSSLPPPHANVPHVASTAPDGNKPLNEWTTECCDKRQHNIVIC